MHDTEFDFSKLSIAERFQFAGDLWDSIPAEGSGHLSDRGPMG
jgi:hypothetical protein